MYIKMLSKEKFFNVLLFFLTDESQDFVRIVEGLFAGLFRVTRVVLKTRLFESPSEIICV